MTAHVDDILAGGGEMGALMRSLDWSKTPVGSVGYVVPGLRTTVRILLANRFPMLLWWGPQYCQLYNDPYRPVLGTKHPESMGQAGAQCWPRDLAIMAHWSRRHFTAGPATWMEDIALEINRHGFVEETHFTIAYSPVPDETVPRGIGGVLATVHEISDKVVGERRVRCCETWARGRRSENGRGSVRHSRRDPGAAPQGYALCAAVSA